MGNQVALAVPDVKPPLVGVFLAVDNRRNGKIGLVIPTNMSILILPFPMLLFVQNAKQPVPQSKAKLRVTVIKLPVIKGRVFREANGERDAICPFFGWYLCFLDFGNDDL